MNTATALMIGGPMDGSMIEGKHNTLMNYPQLVIEFAVSKPLHMSTVLSNENAAVPLVTETIPFYRYIRKCSVSDFPGDRKLWLYVSQNLPENFDPVRHIVNHYCESKKKVKSNDHT